MDIYDRSNWPSPDVNPLVLLLRRPDEWFTNMEIQAALAPENADGPKTKSPMGQWPRLRELLREGDTMMASRHFMWKSPTPEKRTGGLERLFSRRALVLIAFRAQTVNALAFRDWVADQIAGGSFDA